MKHIKDFSDITKKDVNLAGGKGASLGEMTKAGFNVPPGFVVIADAFDRFLDETDLIVEVGAALDEVDKEVMHTIENASEKIQALINNTEIPKDIADEIVEEFNSLGTKFVAVRSSATAEDSARAAWAGQLDTFLNTTKKDLLENVRKCWASLFTPRAIFYRFEKGLHGEKISVAVVVQKMIEPEVSGIGFSVHPVTEDRNQLIIEAGFGLGEAIVSGQITPDSYVVKKKEGVIEDISVNTQQKMLVKVDTVAGVENKWQNIPEETGKTQKLTEKQIKEVANIIIKLEKHYKFPVDIEWSIEKGKLYVLQSRPITTLK
ncbi:hypothetical protein HN695_05815 [Candidatus Woesearchaeota archaeon]|jgi:pyruvate, water dikinase|nr:hypothetical protein [Candidatus Woesearchaeota archaeon]MBT5272602.1 hypothetical protein [Candidatus Woesearchaeota archaeon]MBT6040541.1 hypothetical protein [Candidatus Woesearchaeota archaeon]MBT6337154.1 hypothetical protein [Candidatus Woesearchaeota archaeon]MBT7927826.1 hypothetical protein [Candidatus Woesearchaeota archaeon]